MPSLILSGHNVGAKARSKHLDIMRWETEKDPPIRARVPLNDLDRVVLVGRPRITILVLQRLMRRGIPCYFTTSTGRWIGSLSPDNNLNAARRIRQYEVAKDKKLALRIARRLVQIKVLNSRRVLQRLAANRSESEADEQREITTDLKKLVLPITRSETLDELRGYEGLAAAKYFSRLSAFFPREVPFEGRSRRPPKNPANALLSWTYTILMGEVDCCVRSHGLDPCLGFLHGISHGTPSLSLDLLEPLRAPVCDLLALNLLNHKILTKDSFEYNVDSGGYLLKRDSHKDFFFAYEKHITRKFRIRPGEPHVDFRQVIESQVGAILKALAGEDDFDFFKMP